MPPADEPIVTPAAQVAPAPEVPAPAPTPESPPDPAAPPPEPIVPESPPAEPPATDAPPAEVPVEPQAEERPTPQLTPHTDKPTLMELAGKEEAQPSETPTEAPKPEVAPRTYEPFTVPEGLALDQGRVTAAAQDLFAADNLPQERAQAYVDFHIAEMQRLEAAMIQEHHNMFGALRDTWATQVKADPEIGGAGFQTAMTAIAKMRDIFVSSAAPTSERYQREMAEFNEFLSTTGAGDHPAFNRLMHNVARRFDEPIARNIPYTPPPNIGQRPNGAGSRRDAMYGTVQAGPNGRS